MADGLVSRLKTIKHLDAWIILLLIAAVWLLRIAYLPYYPIPTPQVRDEFANLLGAQTFAVGRLTNPTHPLSEFFLQIHVLSEPTRMMKYQPLPAAFMALGIIGFGHVYWGVVLCISLAIAALYWTARGWLGRIFSIGLSTFFLLLFSAPHYAINSYWGLGPILLSALLLLGAYPRIFYKKQFAYMWLMAIGCALCLFSRPYEGGLLILCLAISGFVHAYRCFSPQEFKSFFIKSIAPFVVIGGSFFAFQAHYNKAITGDYFTAPYAAYQKQYEVAPLFWTGEIKEHLLSSHYGLRQAQEWEMKDIPKGRAEITLIHFPAALCALLKTPVKHLSVYCVMFFSIFIFPFLLLYRNVRQKKYLMLHLAFFMQMAGAMMVTWLGVPHYLAIYLAVYAMLVGVNLRDAYSATIHKKRWHVFLGAASIGILAVWTWNNSQLPAPASVIAQKQAVEKTLKDSGGKHVVLVDLRAEIAADKGGYSWVSNPPDIDKADIIYAWYLSPTKNQTLLAYYSDRKIWYIEPYKEQKLMPYTQHKEKP